METNSDTNPPSALEPCRYTDRQAHCSAGNGAVNNNRIESNKTLWATRDLHSVARTPRTFGSLCYRIQVSHPGGIGSVETSSNTTPPPRPRNQTGTLSAGGGKVTDNRRSINEREMKITG